MFASLFNHEDYLIAYILVIHVLGNGLTCMYTISGISLFTGCHGNEQNECFSLAHDRRSIISLREPNFPIALTAGTQHYFHLLKSVKSVINNDSEFCTLGIHFSIIYIFVTMIE